MTSALAARASWLLMVLMAVLLGLPGAVRAEQAQAEAAESREHRYRLELDSAWRVKPAPAQARALLAGWEHERSGALLAVSRIDYPNLSAWRRRARDGYYDAIVAGIEQSTPGYALMERRASMQGKVPALDLTYRRDGERDEVVLLRFLFFRRYALAVAIAVQKRVYRRHRRALRAAQQSFEPFFD